LIYVSDKLKATIDLKKMKPIVKAGIVSRRNAEAEIIAGVDRKASS
jgi:hypothetical protein